MCSANLTGLPAELLNEIVFHLGYEDRVSLASTHRDLHLLRPKEKTLRPEAFCLQSITYTVALPLLAPSRSTQPFSRHLRLLTDLQVLYPRRSTHPYSRHWRRSSVYMQVPTSWYFPGCMGLNLLLDVIQKLCWRASCPR